MPKFNFVLPDYQKEKLEKRKKETGKSVAQQIRDAIHNHFKQMETNGQSSQSKNR